VDRTDVCRRGGRARREDDALARQSGSGRRQAEQSRGYRSDARRTARGQARRGDDRNSPRREGGRERHERGGADRNGP